ncbi:MAG: FAD/NAD(P)-binding oxidoreductase [Pyrinomonadaceae bacterium]
MNRIAAEVLIVGGGAAGLAAAVAASERAKVVLVDDNPNLGGQIWRAEMGKIKSPDAKKLIDAVSSGSISVINNAQVFAAVGDNVLHAERPDGTLEFEFDKLILATGARERFLPFPGWTLPNVFGAGGLQALVKGGLPVSGKRIVVAGTGPLLLVVAEYLKTKGATVVAIAEQSPARKISKFALGLWRSPSKITQAIALRTRLAGVRYITDCWVESVSGDGRVDQVMLRRKGRLSHIECDILACGFHLVANLELPAILGCKIENGAVTVNELQQTSIRDIFCAGEPTGIAGVESSLIEGKIAGLAATGTTNTAYSLVKQRDKANRFGIPLNHTFALRDELKTLANTETIVCRCEDVAFGQLAKFENFRDAKLQTRCGMGPCQGRICGAATEFLFGWDRPNVRPPIFPVKMENL